MPRRMTGGREQSVQTKNALQRNHKIDHVQITGERAHPEECRHGYLGGFLFKKVLTCFLRSFETNDRHVTQGGLKTTLFYVPISFYNTGRLL